MVRYKIFKTENEVSVWWFFSFTLKHPLWNRQLFAANVHKLQQTTPAIRSPTQTESLSSATSGNTSEIGKTVVKVKLGVA